MLIVQKIMLPTQMEKGIYQYKERMHPKLITPCKILENIVQEARTLLELPIIHKYIG